MSAVRRKRAPGVGTIVLAVFLGLIAMAAGGAAATVIVPAVLPGARTTYDGAGTYRVPAQIAPGTYLVAARGQTYGCYWGRLRDLRGEVKSTAANGSLKRGDRDQFITVTRGDAGVKFIGECTWSRL